MQSRDLIYISFIAFLTLVIAVGAVLFINGYNFAPANNNGDVIVKGGNLRIESVPRGATIFLNDEKKGTTPNEFFNLPPGTLNVRIEKEGYDSWKKEVEIEEGFVTSLFPTLYAKSLIPKVILPEIKIENIIQSFNGQDKILFTQAETKGLWLGDFSRGLFKSSDTTIRLTNETIANIQNYSFHISPEADKILISNSKEKKYYVISTQGINVLPETLLKLNITPTSVKWGANSSSLIIETEELVFNYNLTNDRYVLLINKTTSSPYFVTGDGIVYVNGDSIVISDLNGTIKEDIPLSNYKLTSESITSLFVDSKFQYIFVVKDSILKMINTKTKEIEVVSDKFSNFIGFSPSETSIAFVEESNVIGYFVDESNLYGLKRKSVLGKSTTNYYWSNDSQNLITESTDEKEMSVVSIRDYDGENNVVLFTGKLFDPSLIVTKGKRIIMTTSSEGENQFWEIDLSSSFLASVL